jgi:hypothetical protein
MKFRFASFVTTVFLISINVQLKAQAILYVDSAVAASGNGLSWGTAFKDLSEATDLCFTNAAFTEIRVAKGTYTPKSYPKLMLTQTTGTAVEPYMTAILTESDKVFHVKQGIALTGGYSHGGASNNPDIYKTVLSGILSPSQRAFHVILVDAGSYANSLLNTRLENLTIVGGGQGGPLPNNSNFVYLTPGGIYIP